MKRVLTICEDFIKYLVGALLAAMVAIVFWNVVSRYFLGASIAWSEEISRFMLIWVVFLGALLAYIKDEHLSLDILIKAVPKRIAHLMQVIADVGVLYAIYIIVFGGFDLTMKSWDWLSPAAAIPYAYVYLIIPIAGSAMLIMTIFKLIVHIKVLFGISKEATKEDTRC
jgi:TRAP-type C4-dicarboxylate transport system permease small subunit